MRTGIIVSLGAAALVAFAAIALEIIFTSSADVAGYSDSKGYYRYNCDDPKFLNDSECARRACLATMKLKNALPTGYEAKAVEAWGDPDKVRVEGHLRAQSTTSTLPAKRFSCTYANGHVVMLAIDGATVRP